MKLTTFTRVLLTLAIVAGIYFGFRAISPQSQPTIVESTDTASEVAEAAPVAVDKKSRTFDFRAPVPEEGVLEGVVELGASGFNSFIIRVDEAEHWSLEKAEYGASLVYENMATEADIRAGLKQYIAKMLDYGVGGKKIHFMVSSSAVKAPEVQQIIKALNSLGYVVNTVDATQEGKFALRAVLPEAFIDKAFVVDIGSGNTKIAWEQNGAVKSLETYGSKYYQDNVDDDTVFEDVKSKAGQIPAGLTKTCFIIGGVPYELAKEVRSGEERYTVLKAPGDYHPEGEKLKSGINIYQALAEATGCDTFVFDWDANFTIGFLLSM